MILLTSYGLCSPIIAEKAKEYIVPENKKVLVVPFAGYNNEKTAAREVSKGLIPFGFTLDNISVLPGYNSDWNDMSGYLCDEYDILQLSPLGYNTPDGLDERKRKRGAWPVLYDTVSEIDETVGYNQWFLEVCLAIKALKKEGQKLMFLGTSQGGGAALIMSSIFNECTAACASEMPFLIGFSSFNYPRVRNFVANQIGNPEKMIYDFYAKERLFVIDPIIHSSRITCPVLLIAGELDRECPSEDIFKLYEIRNI